MLKTSIMDLPTPANINSMWNFGSMLGLCLVIQMMTGLFLSFHYLGDSEGAFISVSHITRDVNGGWLLRTVHANGASLFFLCLYAHIGRGLYFSSFKKSLVWISGTALLIMVMATAFLGYVLPWGQMSFWGATVITNLFSAVPIIGIDLVNWMWGGFAVSGATLTRFFSLHFLIPFMIAAVIGIHIMNIHQTGSSNPLGVTSNFYKVKFTPYFTSKDLFGFIIGGGGLILISLWAPWLLGDSENFIPANPLVTPIHIQPEWYFLFAYAILRAIPNKLGGVTALLASVMVLLLMPLIKLTQSATGFNPVSKMIFWSLTSTFLLLTWIGARPVQGMYISTSIFLTLLYFSLFGAYVLSPAWPKIY